MAVGAHALTTLAVLKASLGITASTDDTLLERYIDAASEWLERSCGRHFEYAAAQVDDIPGFGWDKLVLSRPPIGTIASITYDGAAVDITNLVLAQWEKDAGLVPRAGGWTWTAQTKRDVSQGPLPGTERSLFKATYSGGWVTPSQAGTRTLPADIEEACIDFVRGRFLARKRDPAVASERLMSYSVSYTQPSVVEPEIMAVSAFVRDVVVKYRRML